MKILGFPLIIVSCIICGLYYTEQKHERMKDLDYLCAMLELMQGELECRLSSLPEMMNILEKKTKGSALAFVQAMKRYLEHLGEKDLITLWTECSLETLSLLEEGERRAFCSLGYVLGKYDVPRQNQAINECLLVFRSGLSRARNDYPQLRKLSLGVSATAGTLLAIILV